MLEFAQAHYLWLLLLLVAFYVGWLLARRYRKRRVTHAALWQRVAARVVPPAWKRLLRTILTLLVATTMLACVALYAAGLQRSPDEQPAPLVLVIMQDNTVSMRGADRRVQANKRARALLAALGEDDRALLAHFKFGRCWAMAANGRRPRPAARPPTRPDLRACAPLSRCRRRPTCPRAAPGGCWCGLVMATHVPMQGAGGRGKTSARPRARCGDTRATRRPRAGEAGRHRGGQLLSGKIPSLPATASVLRSSRGVAADPGQRRSDHHRA